jgi:hypothetical protein
VEEDHGRRYIAMDTKTIIVTLVCAVLGEADRNV